VWTAPLRNVASAEALGSSGYFPMKVMSGLDISERRLPQDGRISMNVGGRNIDLRVSTLPTQFGESVVLRVLDRSAVELGRQVSGFSKVGFRLRAGRNPAAQRNFRGNRNPLAAARPPRFIPVCEKSIRWNRSC